MILVVSGSRADYGCLHWIIKELEEREIDFYLLRYETKLNESKANLDIDNIFIEAVASVNPDFIFVLGDRWEILTCVQHAVLKKIPVIHQGGGEMSGESYDNKFRNAISLLSDYHFVVNTDCFDRLIKLGIHYSKIWITGSPRLDAANKIKIKKEQNDYILVVYHPETNKSLKEISEQTDLFFDSLPKKYNYIFFNPGLDYGSNIIMKKIASLKKHLCVNSLNVDEWINLLANCRMLVGNSSAGIMEAQIYDRFVVNVGDRQKDRKTCGNVWTVGYSKIEIQAAINFFYDCSKEYNVNYDISQIDKFYYGDGTSSKKIVDILKKEGIV